VSLAACVSCQLGNAPKLMFLQCFSAITLFYCAHWQTYVSGKCYIAGCFEKRILENLLQNRNNYLLLSFIRHSSLRYC